VSISAEDGPGYRERLHVPVRWWAVLLLLLFSLWLAVAVSTPPLVMWAATVLATTIGAGLLVSYGSARLEVTPQALRAGRARLEWACCGPATALDAEETRRLHGVDADPRAYLLVRPYIPAAVRVEVDDPADPTPYWMLSTREPRRLAESINAARVLAD
jgi:hypothetical protein